MPHVYLRLLFVCVCYSEESLLTPIMSTLTGLAKESKHICRYIKTAVFQEAAQAAPGTGSKQQNTSADTAHLPSTLQPHCTLQSANHLISSLTVLHCVVWLVSMVPAGSVSEQQLDVDPLSLRSLLLPYCTSIKFRVKHVVSELLFQLCDEQRQYNKAEQSNNITAQHSTAHTRSEEVSSWLIRPALCLHCCQHHVRSHTRPSADVIGCVQRTSSFDVAGWAMPLDCWQRRECQVNAAHTHICDTFGTDVALHNSVRLICTALLPFSARLCCQVSLV